MRQDEGGGIGRTYTGLVAALAFDHHPRRHPLAWDLSKPRRTGSGF